MADLRLDELQALVEPLLSEQSVELVELTCRPQGRQLHIRLLVDKVGGITIQECARLNGWIGQALEDSDFLELTPDGQFCLAHDRRAASQR